LFDNNIPTLNDLDGNMWARELLTIGRNSSSLLILFYFTDMPDYRGIRRIELVMFNCPEWGIGAQQITVFLLSTSGSDFLIGKEVNPIITSCDSLVRVCIPQFTASEVISLAFNNLDWVYIAEVIFYGAGSSSICPPDIIITPTPDPQTPDTTTPLHATTPPQSTLSGKHLGVRDIVIRRRVICNALTSSASKLGISE
jgi:hypothetical protein